MKPDFPGGGNGGPNWGQAVPNQAQNKVFAIWLSLDHTLSWKLHAIITCDNA